MHNYKHVHEFGACICSAESGRQSFGSSTPFCSRVIVPSLTLGLFFIYFQLVASLPVVVGTTPLQMRSTTAVRSNSDNITLQDSGNTQTSNRGKKEERVEEQMEKTARAQLHS